MVSVFTLDDILIILEGIGVFSNCLHYIENQPVQIKQLSQKKSNKLKTTWNQLDI